MEFIGVEEGNLIALRGVLDRVTSEEETLGEVEDADSLGCDQENEYRLTRGRGGGEEEGITSMARQ